jgi:choline kinase
MWAIWGLVQAREDMEGEVEFPEFDYVGYAQCRMAAFRAELKSLGL